MKATSHSTAPVCLVINAITLFLFGAIKVEIQNHLQGLGSPRWLPEPACQWKGERRGSSQRRKFRRKPSQSILKGMNDQSRSEIDASVLQASSRPEHRRPVQRPTEGSHQTPRNPQEAPCELDVLKESQEFPGHCTYKPRGRVTLALRISASLNCKSK